jgi:hypothetical protein
MKSEKPFLNKGILALIIVVVFYGLFSCSEKPTEPPPPPPPPPVEPDTVSRYIWNAYPTGIAGIYNVYAADTNLVYIIVASAKLLYWNGTGYGMYNLNDPGFYAANVYGFGKNDIFVSGWKTKNGIDIPFVKKITNGVISDIQLDTVETYIYDQLILGPDEGWFSSFLTNAVYHYKDGNVKKYNSYVNDSIITGVFYINANKEIHLFQRQPDYSSLNKQNRNQVRADLMERKSYGPGTMYSFKLVNDTFELISSQCYGASKPNCFTILIYQCGNDALMVSNIEKISVFNGYNWERHSQFDSLDTFAQKIGGVSKDSLVAFTLNHGKLYTYNGIKWRIENNTPWIPPPGLSHSNIEAKFGNIYFCYYSDFDSERGKFYVGKPNKNFKNH